MFDVVDKYGRTEWSTSMTPDLALRLHTLSHVSEREQPHCHARVPHRGQYRSDTSLQRPWICRTALYLHVRRPCADPEATDLSLRRRTTRHGWRCLRHVGNEVDWCSVDYCSILNTNNNETVRPLRSVSTESIFRVWGSSDPIRFYLHITETESKSKEPFTTKLPF